MALNKTDVVELAKILRELNHPSGTVSFNKLAIVIQDFCEARYHNDNFDRDRFHDFVHGIAGLNGGKSKGVRR